MRRSDREITDEQELLQVISECDVCRLALNDEEVPYILPLNFGEEVSDGRLYLYFHGAAEGRKYDLISRDPQTAFEMDCSHRILHDGVPQRNRQGSTDRGSGGGESPRADADNEALPP